MADIIEVLHDIAVSPNLAQKNTEQACACAMVVRFSNRKLIYAIGVSILLQLMVIYVPAIQVGFRTVALGLLDWLVIIAVSSTVLIITQLKIKLFGGFD